MPKKKTAKPDSNPPPAAGPAQPPAPAAQHPHAGRPSPLVDTRVIYCGDNLEQLRKLPDACIDLIYIDPPFNSNRNYEVFWGETKEKRAFEDRHASTQAYIEFMRPRCLELARVIERPVDGIDGHESDCGDLRYRNRETVEVALRLVGSPEAVR